MQNQNNKEEKKIPTTNNATSTIECKTKRNKERRKKSTFLEKETKQKGRQIRNKSAQSLKTKSWKTYDKDSWSQGKREENNTQKNYKEQTNKKKETITKTIGQIEAITNSKNQCRLAQS